MEDMNEQDINDAAVMKRYLMQLTPCARECMRISKIEAGTKLSEDYVERFIDDMYAKHYISKCFSLQCPECHSMIAYIPEFATPEEIDGILADNNLCYACDKDITPDKSDLVTMYKFVSNEAFEAAMRTL